MEQGQRVVTVPLVAIPSSDLFPDTAVSRAFSLTSGSSPSHQALSWWDSCYATYRVFTYHDFMACLKSLLSPGQYGSHSFQRGGATFALEAGVPLDSIAVRGVIGSQMRCICTYICVCRNVCAPSILFLPISCPLESYLLNLF